MLQESVLLYIYYSGNIFVLHLILTWCLGGNTNSKRATCKNKQLDGVLHDLGLWRIGSTLGRTCCQSPIHKSATALVILRRWGPVTWKTITVKWLSNSNSCFHAQYTGFWVCTFPEKSWAQEIGGSSGTLLLIAHSTQPKASLLSQKRFHQNSLTLFLQTYKEVSCILGFSKNSSSASSIILPH